MKEIKSKFYNFKIAKKYIANIFNYLLNNFFYIIIKSIYFGTLIN